MSSVLLLFTQAHALTQAVLSQWVGPNGWLQCWPVKVHIGQLHDIWFVLCRSCASMGYFTDAVLPLLHKSLPSRKPPIINRGTWARHAVFRQITHDFITACMQNSTALVPNNAPADAATAGEVGASRSWTNAQCSSSGTGSSDSSRWAQPICQVVALGAGTDSSWFNLQHQAWDMLPAAHFVEMDFQEVSRLACSVCRDGGRFDGNKRVCRRVSCISVFYFWQKVPAMVPAAVSLQQGACNRCSTAGYETSMANVLL